MNSYFFDSYALFELIRGNINYSLKVDGAGIITTKLNLLELYYHILLRHGEASADAAYAAFERVVVELENDDMKAAAKFRATHTKLKFSFIDCIGYVMAKRRGIKFLTGDIAFQNIENVEFVV